MTAVRAVVEALLFVAAEPLAVEDLQRALGTDADGDDVRAALDSLAAEYREGERGLVLAEVGGRYRLRTAAQVAPWLRDFAGGRPVKLSRAALETLAIVAYRQPCTRADVERIRGVESGGVVRALLDRKLLRIAGRRDLPGKPMVYATSPEFLDTLGLTSLGDLPSLREFADLGPGDIEAVRELLSDDPELIQQVTFEEYAARRALARVDAAASERLAGRPLETDAR